MFCSNCGSQLPDDAKFCGSCGSALAAPTPYEMEAVAQEPVTYEVATIIPEAEPFQAAAESDPAAYTAAPAPVTYAADPTPAAYTAAPTPEPAPTPGTKSRKFATSLLCPWIKGEVETDYRFVNITSANAIFGLIPAGKDHKNFPLKNINGASTSSSFSASRLVGGGFIALLGLGWAMQPNGLAVGIIMLLFGLVLLFSGIQNVLTVTSGNDVYTVSVPFWEGKTMKMIQQDIQAGLSRDVDKTDLNMFFGQMTQMR